MHFFTGTGPFEILIQALGKVTLSKKIGNEVNFVHCKPHFVVFYTVIPVTSVVLFTWGKTIRKQSIASVNMLLKVKK